MVSTNTQNKLPSSALVYMIIGRAIVGVILVIIGTALTLGGSLHGTSTVNGVTSPSTFSGAKPGIAFIIVGILIPLWSILWYSTFSYIVGDQNITINSGVLFRQSRTIDFNEVQNVDNTRGPLQMMFGLTSVNIWTASQDQFRTSVVTVGGVPRTRNIAKPDGKLYLSRHDADDLKNYMSGQGSVQNVRAVS